MTTTATALKSHLAFDDSKAEAFAGRLLGALNNSALVLMTSIGHRTGLFDHLAEHFALHFRTLLLRKQALQSAMCANGWR